MTTYPHPLDQAGSVSEAMPRPYPDTLTPPPTRSEDVTPPAAVGLYEIFDARRRRAACCYTCRHRIEVDPFTGRHSCGRYGGEVKPWWTCDSHIPLEV